VPPHRAPDRCESWLAANKDCNKRFQAWLTEMSNHVRSLDSNHLITIGSEGFYGDSTPELMQYNPQAWARELGQDFVLNTNLPNVDFATVHAWPDNWMLPQDRIPAFLDKWVQSHMSVGANLSAGAKPVMFEVGVAAVGGSSVHWSICQLGSVHFTVQGKGREGAAWRVGRILGRCIALRVVSFELHPELKPRVGRVWM
jgi:hypothetical protein